eukprot:2093122-Rhodomonas_salina.1
MRIEVSFVPRVKSFQKQHGKVFPRSCYRSLRHIELERQLWSGSCRMLPAPKHSELDGTHDQVSPERGLSVGIG